MINRFQEHITATFPNLFEAKVLIACSGGLDSVVLAHLCVKIGCQVAFAHCNFGLRGQESDGDEHFVRELARKMDAAVFVNHFDTKTYGKIQHISIQMAARALRYDWFQKLVVKGNFSALLTGHHADDNLETFMINMSRGAGLEGLKGIPKINGFIARPLLPFSRNELLAYANSEGITWREDSSNAETKYVRNKLRHEIIPVIKRTEPHILQQFMKSLSHIADSAQFIADTVQRLQQDLFEYGTNEESVIRVNIGRIKELGDPKIYVYQLFKDYGFTAWKDVQTLLDATSGKQVFSKEYRLLKDRDYLLLSPRKINDAKKVYTIQEDNRDLLLPNARMSFQKVTSIEDTNRSCIYVDQEKLTYPLYIRRWKKGDYFFPLGMNGRKKISKFFKDEKLSLLEKENTWFLCSEDTIVWVIGYRPDDRFKVTDETKSIIKISSN